MNALYLVNLYLDKLRAKINEAPVDLLVICPKGLELRALQIVFEVDADNPTAVIDGFHFFDGQFESSAAKRPVTFSLVCLGGQTNVRAARKKSSGFCDTALAEWRLSLEWQRAS